MRTIADLEKGNRHDRAGLLVEQEEFRHQPARTTLFCCAGTNGPDVGFIHTEARVDRCTSRHHNTEKYQRVFAAEGPACLRTRQAVTTGA